MTKQQLEHYEFMNSSILLDPIQILYDSSQKASKGAVLITDSIIEAFGDEARIKAKNYKISTQNAHNLILAPCLVDPHSILEEPINSYIETIASLTKKAAYSGYGQIAILPRSNVWRDSPEKLQSLLNLTNDVLIHPWGSFSKEGKHLELSPHADLLKHGAIGLAEDDSIPPISFLKKGLLLGEIEASPLLVAPRDKQIQANGIVRECVETLRAGWNPDPIETESIALSQILELQKQHPKVAIRLMNISTEAGILMLEKSKLRPISSVFWWHLVSDISSLSPSDLGWKVLPSLGNQKNRIALIEALRKKIINAISVHSIPLSEEQTMQPEGIRPAGLCGHNLVLSSLWQELIIKERFSIEQLWEYLSFGPSKMLDLKEESLIQGSNRWLIFDPNKKWKHNRQTISTSNAANYPWEGKTMTGKVIACGLTNQEILID